MSVVDLVVVQSGGQRFAFSGTAIQGIERSTAGPTPSLATLLGGPIVEERYAMRASAGEQSSVFLIAGADLVQVAEHLPLPVFLHQLVHPAIAGFIVYDQTLVPLLDVAAF